jgi:ribosomal protein L44E
MSIPNYAHGEKVQDGNLTGTTDTDYFYFFCPECKDRTILQITDYKVRRDGPVEYAGEDRPRAKRDFNIIFELNCMDCGFQDYVKVANTGWQGGELPGAKG